MKKLSKNLTFWVFIGAMLGFALSKLVASPEWVTSSHPVYESIIFIKSVFIKLLKMMIAPIVFFSLLGGVISIGEVVNLKKMGKVALSYYVITTSMAVIVGLIVVFFVHPWKSEKAGVLMNKTFVDSGISYIAPKKIIDPNADSFIGIIQNIADMALVNPFDALASNNILGIVFFALLIGLALVIVHSKDSPLHQLTKDINSIIHRILNWIIKLSPFGVFAIVFDFSLKTSGAIFHQLLSFCLVVFAATMFHGLVILPLIAKLYTGISLKRLFKAMARPMLIAFSTASSSASLPVTMQSCEEDLNVSQGVSGFVLPLGATMNMDGTALFEGVAAVFLAHLYGVELSNVAISSIFLMSMVSSIGAPGMPSGSMSGMQMVLLAAGLPVEAIGVLLVVERPLDTFRTAVNVEGDMIGAVVTQKFIDRRS